MRIPLPYRFGEAVELKKGMLLFYGVTWFLWYDGMEYTYFFRRNDFWHDVTFYHTRNEIGSYGMDIPDSLLVDKAIKEHGYPLKGRGYVCGIFYINAKLYLEFLITSNYYAHIKVECDEYGGYVKGGHMIFPMAWDMEKRQLHCHILRQR